MQRHWINFERPFLPAVAGWLLERAGADVGEVAVVDLRSFVCVTPGRRGGRVLLAELVRRCEAEGRVLLPPDLVTPGSLAPALLDTNGALASTEERCGAWMAALHDMPRDARAALLPEPPDSTDTLGWYRLAVRFERLERELSGELVSFEGMRAQCETLHMLNEADRWRALDEARTAAHDRLAACGRVDPDAAFAHALDRGAIVDARSVCLIGITDLNAQQRAVIDALGRRVTAMIMAPEAWGDRFDAHGCVRPEVWADVQIDVDDTQLVVADQTSDQAQAALDLIADHANQRAAHEITVGLGDEGLVDAFMTAGRWAGVRFHDAAGRALDRTAPGRLLASIADWIDAPTLEHLATMVRHPDLEAWIGRQGCAGTSRAMAALDRFASRRLATTAAPPAADQLDDREREADVDTMVSCVRSLVAPLHDGPRPLVDWMAPMMDVLRAVYGDGPNQPEARRTRLVSTLRAVRDLALARRAVHMALQPVVTGAEALRIILADAAMETVADEPRTGEIEMLGWLELALDPAPIVIVAGVNDGSIPSAVTADAFLPESLRAHAGLMNNARRYARDAHVLTALQHRECLRLIAGRRDDLGEPHTPSRLLLAGAPETLAARVCQFSDEQRAFHAADRRGAAPPAPISSFVIPPPPETPVEIDRMAVTAFRMYLLCPYRFWLSRIERLRRVPIVNEELDPMQFGTLVHDALDAFGNDAELRDSTDSRQIHAFLTAEIDRLVAEAYGADPPPAVHVQVTRIRTRLDAFARAQAAHRREGWRIQAAELPFPMEVTRLQMRGDAPDMPVSGKIDRVDRHDETGQWLIIDYKTSDKAKDPDTMHRTNGEWVDLQLPLYGHFAPALGFEGPAALAYFTLPRDAAGTKLRIARWDDDERADAIDVARRVVQRVRDGDFRMTDEYPSRFTDDFEYICQTTVLGVNLDDEDLP